MISELKRYFFIAAVGCVSALVGCEYTGTGDSNSFNSYPDWANFSGVYKGAGGGTLVSAFTSDPGNGGTPGGTNFLNATENVDTGNGSKTSFGGTLSHTPIVAASLNITAGGYEFIDQGTGTLTGGGPGMKGSVDYGTGAWSLDLQGFPLASGQAIVAKYSYIVATPGTPSTTSSTGQGSSGMAIYSFTVFQAGNKIEITDNNGAKYGGQLGKVVTTSGITAETDKQRSATDTLLPSVGDSVIAEYTAEGTSAAGVSVMLTGTFQGVISRGSGADYLSDRRMLGTWSESKGVTGDINGASSPIAVSSATTTPTTTP